MSFDGSDVQLLTFREAAKRLRVSMSTFYKKILPELVTVTVAGDKRLVTEADLVDYINQRRQRAG